MVNAMETSTVQKGITSERRVAAWLRSKRLKVIESPRNAPFDLLVNGWRCNVKYATAPNRRGRWSFNIHHGGVVNESEVDFYILMLDSVPLSANALYLVKPAPLSVTVYSVSLRGLIGREAPFVGAVDALLIPGSHQVWTPTNKAYRAAMREGRQYSLPDVEFVDTLPGMSKTIAPRDLPAYLTKKQGDQSNTVFAASLGISRQYLSLLQAGSFLPTPRCLAGMSLEVALRIKATGRFLRLADLGAYLTKRQGKKSEIEAAAEYDLTRQHYHQIKVGLTAMPAAWALEKLGMEIQYREAAKKAKR